MTSYKQPPGQLRFSSVLLAALLAFGVQAFAATPTVNLFSTGFEASEGYDPLFDLEGQQGWLGTDTNGIGESGVLENFFPGHGQQAYIGFSALATNESYFSVWQPLNLAPIPTNYGRIAFSVLMGIADSSTNNARYDDFFWSVYNTNGHRLFLLDFDNDNWGIYYVLDDSGDAIDTGKSFTNDVTYQLQILMDFPRNRWSATLDGSMLVTNLPITKTNAALNLGDVDAEWYIRQPGSPGDNYMLFDDYQVTADLLAPPPRPIFVAFDRSDDGTFYGRVIGQPGRNYVILATTDLKMWNSITTNTANPSGVLDFIDFRASSSARKYYRARLVP